jgi:hypothetical protein
MTIEIQIITGLKDTVFFFGTTALVHKETRYILALIDEYGDIIFTNSPLILRTDECIDDEDFGCIAKKILEKRLKK